MTKRKILSSIGFLSLSTLVTVWVVNDSLAQPQVIKPSINQPANIDNPISPEAIQYWKNINDADQKIGRLHVQWDRKIEQQPDPTVDPDVNEKKNSVLIEKENPANQDVMRQLVDIQKGMDQQQFYGFIQDSQITLSSDRIATRADVWLESPQSSRKLESATKPFQILEYFDGQNSLAGQILGVGSSKEAFSNLGNIKLDLYQDEDRALANSAPDIWDKLFLLGEPVGKWFTPTTTTVKKLANNDILLEANQGVPPRFRLLLTVSATSWRPLKLERVGVRTGKVYQRTTVTEFRKFDGGISFPSRIEDETSFRKGVAFKVSRYILNKALFNEASDPESVKLPPGILIADHRFSEFIANPTVRVRSV